MKKKKISPSSKLQCDFLESIKANGMCNKGLSYVYCRNKYRCYTCEHKDLLYSEDLYDPIPFPLGSESSVIEDKKKTNVYYKKSVLVTPEALEKLGREKLLYYQMFYCEDGPGTLPGNTVGAINGYFLSAKSQPVTLLRSDILGIPTFSICKTYDNNFFTDTCKICGYLREEGDVYDCAELTTDHIGIQTKIKF